MNITQSAAPNANVLRKLETAPQKAPEAPGDRFVETYLGKTTVYGYDAEGKLMVVGGDGKNPGKVNFLDRTKALAKRVILPPNSETSVSKDYLPTRGWNAAHRLVHGAGGAAILAATGAALANDPTWGAALKGGAMMAAFNQMRAYVCNGTGFATSFVVEKAEKNPRAWTVAGEAISNAGLAVGALSAVPQATAAIPGGFATLALAGAAISTVGGVMKGAALANVYQRQALDGNLAQVNIANSHQDMIVDLAGGGLGFGIMMGLQHNAPATVAAMAAVPAIGLAAAKGVDLWKKSSLGTKTKSAILATGVSGLGALGYQAVQTGALHKGLQLIQPYLNATSALPAVAAVTGIVGAVLTHQWVKQLDYFPVTESALRRVIEGLDKEGKIPPPKADRIKDMIANLGDRDKIELGDFRPPATHQRFQMLNQLYQGRDYILDIQGGKPAISVQHDVAADDRCQAVIQAIHAEKLLASPEYTQMVTDKGQTAAEEWVLKESLEKTPADIHGFLKQMKEAGWSIDIMKFSDAGRRGESEGNK